MPPAARSTDPTAHPGIMAGPGVPTVLIGGMPAAVMGDTHSCAMPPLAGPHPPTPDAKAAFTTLVGGKPVARLGDMAACSAPIIMGMFTVEVGG